MPQVYVFTGSSKLAQAPKACATVARATIEELRPAGVARFITGAQYGIDILAMDECLLRYPWADHSIWCPAKRYAHREVGTILERHALALAEAGGRITRHHCIPGSDYRYRNLCMLNEAYGLVHRGYTAQVLAYPLHPEDDPRSKYSGTWLCTRQAAAAALPVVVHPLWT